jgi:hypothetical protein
MTTSPLVGLSPAVREKPLSSNESKQFFTNVALAIKLYLRSNE